MTIPGKWGLRPVMLPLAEDAREIVSHWQPQAVVLGAGRPDWLQLLSFLGKRGIPCVLLGTSAQLREAERRHAGCLQLLVPAEPDEVAHGAQVVIGPPAAKKLPDRIDLGVVRIDLRTRTVEVDGIPEVLPPRSSRSWCSWRCSRAGRWARPSCWAGCGAGRSRPRSTTCTPGSGGCAG